MRAGQAPPLRLFGALYRTLTPVFSFQSNEVLETLTVQVVAAREVGCFTLLTQSKQETIRGPFREAFDKQGWLCRGSVERLPGVGQFMCGYRLEQSSWQ
jgi:hypothetical protein